MWFGRIVPLLQFPLIDRQGDRSALESREVEEERSMPLLNELCLGMNIDDGTALYVTYGINEDLNKWGDDLAGWFAIAPFPPTLFGTEQLMHLGVKLINKPGMFRGGVTEPIKKGKGVFLYMEVLGTGDVGGLILHQKDEDEKIRSGIEEGIGTDDQAKLRSIELRLWGDEKSISEKSIPRKSKPKQGSPPIPPKGWYRVLKTALEKNPTSSPPRPNPPPSELQTGRWTDMFKEDRIKWGDDRRILVRDRHITIPYGEFWYNLKRKNKENRKLTRPDDKSEEKPIRPNYCLLARDMELPILLALIPNRPLFRIDMNVSVRKGNSDDLVGSGISDDPVGVGIMDKVADRLEKREINVWHIHETHRSLSFDPLKDAKGGRLPAKLRGADSHITIVASVPKDRGHDSPHALAAYLQDLREELLQLRLQNSTLRSVAEQIEKLPKDLIKEYEKARRRQAQDPGTDSLNLIPDLDLTARRLIGRLINSNFNRLKKEVLEPSFVRDVDIHGPPLFRCFLSHSASPEYDERDHITRLKAILEAEVFEVVEGEFSLGQSTEALSRGRIRHCDLFVSFLWPRESYRRADGTYSPPEWIVHEESFAIGQEIRVYRIIEESVENPRYEHDRPPLKFKKNDLDSWGNLERAFRLEIRQLALRILLGTK